MALGFDSYTAYRPGFSDYFIYLKNFHICRSGSVSSDQNAKDVSECRIQNRPNMHNF